MGIAWPTSARLKLDAMCTRLRICRGAERGLAQKGERRQRETHVERRQLDRDCQSPPCRLGLLCAGLDESLLGVEGQSVSTHLLGSTATHLINLVHRSHRLLSPLPKPQAGDSTPCSLVELKVAKSAFGAVRIRARANFGCDHFEEPPYVVDKGGGRYGGMDDFVDAGLELFGGRDGSVRGRTTGRNHD